MKTGFCVAKGGVQSLLGVTPDISTFAKAMANGYPISAIGGREEVMRTATDIYEVPRSRLVADFIGSINLFEGRVARLSGTEAQVELPDLGGVATAAPVPGLMPGQPVALAVRPEKLTISRQRPEGPNVVPGRVKGVAYFGKDLLYRVALPSGRVLSVISVNARRTGESGWVADWADEVWLSFAPAAAILLLE